MEFARNRRAAPEISIEAEEKTVKILVLSDQESKSIYEYYSPEKLAGVELILACGDLRQEYLDFFATMCHAPLFYVHGNHDRWSKKGWQSSCVSLEDDIVEYKGIRILGLGGSMRYHPDGKYQYTEAQMQRRIAKLWWKLARNKGFDILVTHAPAKGINDLDDLPHQGFSCFKTLMERYHPALFVHGHIHANYGNFKRIDQFGDTMVVNAYDHYILDLPERKKLDSKEKPGP